MPLTKDQIKDEALRLAPAEREALADELLLSIGDQERDEIDEAWLALARTREQAFQQGDAIAKPVVEVLERLRRKAGQ